VGEILDIQTEQTNSVASLHSSLIFLVPALGALDGLEILDDGLPREVLRFFGERREAAERKEEMRKRRRVSLGFGARGRGGERGRKEGKKEERTYKGWSVPWKDAEPSRKRW